MKTADSITTNALAEMTNRGRVVADRFQNGGELPTSFRTLPDNSDALPEDVSTVTATRRRLPILDKDRRQGKNYLRRYLFAGVATLAGLTGVAAVGYVGDKVVRHVEAIDSTVDLSTAGNVGGDPTQTVTVEPTYPLNGLDGLILEVDPDLPTYSATFEQIYDDVERQLDPGQGPNDLIPGQTFNIPKLPDIHLDQDIKH